MPRIAESLSDLTKSEAAAVSDVAEIAGAGIPTTDSVEAVFSVLAKLIPLGGLSLSVPDTLTGRHRTLASSGYSDDLLAFLDSNYLRDDPAYRWIRRTGSRFANWRSPGFDYAHTASAIDWFIPAGFSGGSTNHLRIRDRYLGELHISTDDPRLPTPRSLSVVNLMAPILSAIISDRVLPQRLLEQQPMGTCGAILVAGRPEALPGRPRCPLFGPNSALINLATARREDLPPNGITRRWHDGDRWHRVTLVATGRSIFLMHRGEPLPHGLTARELEVMTYVSRGLTNRAVANRLRISAATVGRHLEHIMGKLDVGDRVAMSRIAHVEGLLLL